MLMIFHVQETAAIKFKSFVLTLSLSKVGLLTTYSIKSSAIETKINYNKEN